MVIITRSEMTITAPTISRYHICNFYQRMILSLDGSVLHSFGGWSPSRLLFDVTTNNYNIPSTKDWHANHYHCYSVPTNRSEAVPNRKVLS